MLDYDIVKSAGVILGIIGAIFTFFYFQILKDKDSFQKFLIMVEENKPLSTYHSVVERVMGVIHRFFGPPKSRKSFVRILLIAFAYPILFFLICYCISGNTMLGGLGFMPEQQNGFIRFGLVLLFVGLAAFTGIVLRNDEVIAGFFIRQIPIQNRKILSSLSFLFELIVGFAVGVVVGVGGVFAVDAVAVGGGVVAGTIGVFVVVVVVGGVVGGGGVGVGVVGVVIGVVVGVSRVFVSSVGGGVVVVVVWSVIDGIDVFGRALSIVSITLLLLLPLANSIFDYISFEISRFLTRKSCDSTSKILISGLLLGDLFIAVLLLIGTAMVLPSFVEIFNFLGAKYTETFSIINWRQMAVDARDYPFSKGIAVTLMLFSTLIWTVIHAVIAFVSLVLAPAGRELIINQLKKEDLTNWEYMWGAGWLTGNVVFSLLLFLGVPYAFFTWVVDIPLAGWLYYLATDLSRDIFMLFF
ncbi:hypothetical protein [Desulfobacula sp.]|uniref:hypothetical protein n=1 Tax=Desulfobacula sp. TaxID=2593537 RepID=UPI00261FF178|nr:hypothetical protein [Desulfobacula sp.]